MLTTIIAATVALASSVVAQTGSAIVVNSCDYDVYLYDVPAADGGYSEIDQVLSSGGSFSQEYTELSNSDGWSIKLSQSTDLSNIMQYEYTFHDDGIIWFDLSDVNGNPWDGNWEITATGSCTPRQAAYRYSTDDAYGMQSCASTSTITVELCSGGNSTSSSSSSSSSEAETSTATATTFATSTSAGTYTTTSESVSSAVSTETSATTYATTTTAVLTNSGTVTTVTASAVFTSTATNTYWQHNRHSARHAHGRRH